MVLAGLLAAASPVLGSMGTGGGSGGGDAGAASAEATVTTTSTLTGGAMTQGVDLKWLIIGGIALWLVLGSKKGRKGGSDG